MTRVTGVYGFFVCVKCSSFTAIPSDDREARSPETFMILQIFGKYSNNKSTDIFSDDVPHKIGHHISWGNRSSKNTLTGSRQQRNTGIIPRLSNLQKTATSIQLIIWKKFSRDLREDIQLFFNN